MYLDGQVEDMSRVGRFEDGDQYTATVWLDIHMGKIPAPFREEFERAEAAYDDQSQCRAGHRADRKRHTRRQEESSNAKRGSGRD